MSNLASWHILPNISFCILWNIDTHTFSFTLLWAINFKHLRNICLATIKVAFTWFSRTDYIPESPCKEHQSAIVVNTNGLQQLLAWPYFPQCDQTHEGRHFRRRSHHERVTVYPWVHFLCTGKLWFSSLCVSLLFYH